VGADAARALPHDPDVLLRRRVRRQTQADPPRAVSGGGSHGRPRKGSHERTKTKHSRHVLPNERVLHALAEAGKIATQKKSGDSEYKDSPYVFPPARGADFIQESSVTDKHFKQALRALGIRDRPQYNARHTYATMCLMAGMSPAFIAGQLGHSVQMLLSTYARWINSTSDWDELEKLNGTKLVQMRTGPA